MTITVRCECTFVTANELLAIVYDPELSQYIGVDGEFWHHKPHGDWAWLTQFEACNGY